MANLLDIREILDVNSFQKIQDDIAKATEFAMLQQITKEYQLLGIVDVVSFVD